MPSSLLGSRQCSLGVIKPAKSVEQNHPFKRHTNNNLSDILSNQSKALDFADHSDRKISQALWPKCTVRSEHARDCCHTKLLLKGELANNLHHLGIIFYSVSA